MMAGRALKTPGFRWMNSPSASISSPPASNILAFEGDSIMTIGKNQISRRRFNQGVLGAGAAALAAPAFLRGVSLNEKLNIAVIGAGGRGASDTSEVKS